METVAARRHSVELLDAKYDNTFKHIIGAGWANYSDGNVESPTGHFAVIEVPDHKGARDELNDAIADGLDPDQMAEFADLRHGWFLAMEDSNGFIHVYRMTNERRAKKAFDDLANEYSAWSQAQDAVSMDEVAYIEEQGYLLGSWHTRVTFEDGLYKCSCGVAGIFKRGL